MTAFNAANSPVEVRVERHVFRWEPPDLGHVVYDGDVDADTMVAFSKQTRLFTTDKPHVFLLVDTTKLGRFSAQARRMSADGSKGIKLRGIAVVGASRPIRVVTELVARGVDLLNQNNANPTRFFETEAEARVWIESRRKSLGAPR